MKGLHVAGLARYLLRHPTRAPMILHAAWCLRAARWWRHPPFLPLPHEAYWRFRLSTATGSPTGSTTAKEIVEFAAWSRRQKVGR